MNTKPIIVWFRNDLRLKDNPALAEAAAAGGPVVPVYIHAPDEEGDWRPGAASEWWLHHSLQSLEKELSKYKSHLVVRLGPAIATLRSLVSETGAGAVFWNRRYEAAVVARDQKVTAGLERNGIYARTFNAGLLFDPDDLRTSQGNPYQVFTPFWKACLSRPAPDPPLGEPRKLPTPPSWPESLPIGSLNLLPKVDWAKGIRDAWQPGETGAHLALENFCHRHIEAYEETRNIPSVPGTSRISPFLHFGEISPRQVWHAVTGVKAFGDANLTEAVLEHAAVGQLAGEVEAYHRQLVWREFAHHLLHHFPNTPDEPLRPEFNRFPWRKDAMALKAWQRGLTGYPIIDAGMRELWATGWMHNRVRMIAASFLVKHLLIPWQDGAKWFWDTLVDADLANNTLGWQWVAGSGADAAPYFRIFNPMLQSRRFDSDGEYIKRWVPELRQLPPRWIHAPSGGPPLVLTAAGITLGRDYPEPIIEHEFARKRALAAYEIIKGRK